MVIKKHIDVNLRKYDPKQLADDLEVSLNTIYRWERDENTESMLKFMKYLKAIGLDYDDYISKKNDMNI